ncbi:MAG: GNAT family N-acetyltransferase [Candidatus Hydrogenedentota bacterium]|nr:MAG: GNAT family N-acetyltransferase [Candidatus Hydrogenedentota bacterium]
MYFYIQDIIVLPEFQGKGIGERILGAILDRLRTHAHHNAFVGVTAAMGVRNFMNDSVSRKVR